MPCTFKKHRTSTPSSLKNNLFNPLTQVAVQAAIKEKEALKAEKKDAKTIKAKVEKKVAKKSK